MRKCRGYDFSGDIRQENDLHVESRFLAILLKITGATLFGTHLSCAECAPMLTEAGMVVLGTRHDDPPGQALRALFRDKPMLNFLRSELGGAFR